MRTKKVDEIELLLSKLDKEELCEFIRKECAGNKQFRQRFLALGAGTIFCPRPADYQSRVKGIIEDFGGRRGYVEYRDTFDLNRAVCKILEEADVAMSKHRWEIAMAILEGVAAVGEDIIYCGDDSAGELSGIVAECFEKWHELCGKELLPQKIKSEIFELSIGYFAKGHLKGYDWWWDWIQMAISLADTSGKQERVVEALDNVIHSKGDEWSVEYNIRAAQRYKLELMSRSGTPEEQREFMYENVSNPDFRKRLLRMAWDEGNYEEVLRLAEDGVTHDSKYIGLVNDWHKWELMTYRQKNDKANTLKLSRYFFFAGGGFGEKEYSMESLYALMRSIVTGEEWNDFVEALIKECLKKKDVVRRLFVYTREKMWDRYMEYLREAPSVYQIDDAPREVWRLYKDELLRLYTSCVRSFFQSASNRGSYSDGVALLRKLIQYGGKAEADQIVVEQKTRTPRRPALIDELSKL